MNEPKAPAGLNKTEIVTALRAIRARQEVANRIDLLSARFLGRAYLDAPLGGGPDRDEQFSAATEGFDCVTYVETVLALALSENADSFPEKLRLMRYNRGKVGWQSRNHYMVDWAARNEAAGVVRNCTAGAATIKRSKSLNLISSLPPKRVTIRCLPKRWVANHRFVGESSDVVMFVSTRRNLDVFHMGFLIRRDGKRLLRHASRTAGRVVEEVFEDFLKKHRMSGVILLRPQCQN